MKLNVSEHVSDLNELETIQLRNHIGNGYNLADDLDKCIPEENYEIQKRKITDTIGRDPFTAIVPIITINIEEREEAHKTYKIAESYSDENCIGIYDVWYDGPEDTMIITLEPFEL